MGKPKSGGKPKPGEIADLPKAYTAGGVEQPWYVRWEKAGLFQASLESSAERFSIVIPPPNVTGSLHIGHALNQTLQDILVRYKKMSGANTLWLPGLDHAGIATQLVVERQAAEEGRSRHEIGREAFVDRIWRWKEESGGQILVQMRRLGLALDWSIERFTMDEGLSRAVRTVFKRLFDEGLIYRGDYIINWCPTCHTALSDLEVEQQETAGKLYHIRYRRTDGKGHLVLATTRPETLLGDTAVAVNPDDPRYRGVETEVEVPRTGRRVPLILDPIVDPDFGTGVLKITPAHDFNDFEVGRRHSLPSISVISETGLMNDNAGEYAGLDRTECRRRILADLEAEGLLERVKDYPLLLGRCYRCHTTTEPLVSKQWFVKTRPLADPAAAAVREGRIRFIPKHWENTYFDWMEKIRDWCISRQLWWGHRIPAWTCSRCGRLVVEIDPPDSCGECGGNEIVQDEDVLDTWFSSALWPFSTMGWPEETRHLRLFYPTSALVTSFDIIFFWVARMIMMGLKFTGKIPFRDIYIHALVLDEQGSKMSKTRGNVLDPLVLIDRYGADTVRLTLAALAAQGRSIRLSEKRVEGYRNFVNKLWNATRFALINLSGYNPNDAGEMDDPNTLERGILARLGEVAGTVSRALESYRFNDAANCLYHFVWHEFCDYYIEDAKRSLARDVPEKRRRRAQHTLANALDTIVRLLHPIVPFVTEEIASRLPTHKGYLLERDYPKASDFPVDAKALATMQRLLRMVDDINRYRGEMGVTRKEKPALRVKPGSEEDRRIISENLETINLLSATASVDEASFWILGEPSKESAGSIAISGSSEFYIERVLNEHDRELEKGRLGKQEKKLGKELEFVQRKLSNPDFLKNAPKEVVEKERSKAGKLCEELEKVQKQIQRFS